MKIKYNIINPRTGMEEDWTGVFQNEELADKWYAKHGVEWAKKYTLVRVRLHSASLRNFTSYKRVYMAGNRIAFMVRNKKKGLTSKFKDMKAAIINDDYYQVLGVELPEGGTIGYNQTFSIIVSNE